MVPPPVVTGISPKEGVPGTVLTIRGEILKLCIHFIGCSYLLINYI